MTKPILTKDNILLDIKLTDRNEAIRQTGKVLVEKGYVEPSYIEKMIEREQITSTFMGNYVAIPHGTDDAKEMVVNSGISILQVPDGVDFGNGNIAKLLIGIAGKNNEHLEILSKIAIVCSEEENIQKIVSASTEVEIMEIFNEVN